MIPFVIYVPSLLSLFLRCALYFNFLARFIISSAVWASLNPLFNKELQLDERQLDAHYPCLLLLGLNDMFNGSSKER